MPVLQAARHTHEVVGTHRVRCFGDGLHRLGLPCPDAKHEPHPDRVESLLGTSECVVSPPSFSMSEPITKKMSFPASNELSLMSPFVVRVQMLNTLFLVYCRTSPRGKKLNADAMRPQASWVNPSQWLPSPARVAHVRTSEMRARQW